MNLYLVTRTDEVGYDQYDAFVVAANSPEEARQLLVTNNEMGRYGVWSDKNEVKLIGTTDEYTEPTEILGSFNAG